MNSVGLKEKTINGVGWSAVDNVANYGITFIVGVVLARLLSPDEYGLIGIVSIFIALFNVIVDSGFSSALIRKKDAGEKDYNTVFYVNIVISVFLTSLLFFSAPLVATFFGKSELIRLTRAMSCVLLINSFSIVQKSILTKKIDFKTQTKISVIAHSVSGLLGILFALCGYGVWALVIQQISSRTFTTILLWVFNRWVPKLLFSWDSFRDLFSFSWKLLVAQIINSLWQQMYQVVIGKCYNSETLGQYTRAKQFADIFSSNITMVVRRVTFPVLSTIQDDRDRTLVSYKQLIKITMFVSSVCLLGMAAIARPLVLVLIGEKWLPCVPILQILCFTFILYPIEVLNVNMLTVRGRSDLLLWLEIIQKIIAIVPLLLGIFVDIYWMLYGSMFASWLNFAIISHFSGAKIGYSGIRQLLDIMPSFLISLTMFALVWLLTLLPISYFIILPLQIVIGSSLLIALCHLFHIEEYMEIKKIIVSYVSKLSRK